MRTVQIEREEQYGDMLRRLYPQLFKSDKYEKVNVQSVTFQITDECNLKCFPAGTKILMGDFSYKNIEDVNIGDTVMSIETIDGQVKLATTKVTFLFRSSDIVRKLTTETNRTVITTDEHPFLSEDKSWTEAKDLKPGSAVMMINGINRKFRAVRIAKNEICSDKEIPVFNMETESHVYIADNFLVHNCTYCYQINKGKRVMSFETAKKMIDRLLDGEKGFHDYINPEKSPGIILDFIGGEPFLQVALIDKIVDYFRERTIALNHPWASKFRVSICTNGTLGKKPEVRAFIEKHKAHLSYSVTVDGNKELHDSCRIFPDGSGSYDLAIDSVNYWLEKGGHMGSKITIAPANVDKLAIAIKEFIDFGYKNIHANCVFEEGWNYDHAKILYEQLKEISDYMNDNELVDSVFFAPFNEEWYHPKKEDELEMWCGGTGDAMLAVDPDGKLYPCLRYMESSLGSDRPPVIIGTVDDGISMCPDHKKCRECMNGITRRTQSTDECFYCPIAEGCSYCSAYNYQVFGTPNSRATFICCMHKAMSLANVYHWNRYYRKHHPEYRFKMWLPKEEALKIVSEEEYKMLETLEH